MVKAGAVYRPPVEIVPIVEFPPATPSTDHFTAVLLVPVTVAVNCCVCVVPSVTDFGAIETVIGVSHETVTVALADLLTSAALTAVTL